MREIRSFSLIFADFCRFSLFLVITAFRGRRFSQKTAGNRRFSQKPQETADFCRNPFVPFSLSLLVPPYTTHTHTHTSVTQKDCFRTICVIISGLIVLPDLLPAYYFSGQVPFALWVANPFAPYRGQKPQNREKRISESKNPHFLREKLKGNN